MKLVRGRETREAGGAENEAGHYNVWVKVEIKSSLE